MSLDVQITHQIDSFFLDVAFSADKTGVTALFGPSGAGKTTLVRAIAGLLRPNHGRVRINGRTVLDSQSGQFLPARDRGVGYVFQDGRLFPHMTVRSNLVFGEQRAGDRTGHTSFDEVVTLLGLGPLLDRRPRTLSGGERQRVALGRALLSRPTVLLLDEPLAALDRERKAEILPLLERLRDTSVLPMIYVSHAIEEVARLADEVVVLRDGRVQAHGSVFDVMSRPDLFPGLPEADAGAVVVATVVEHDASTRLTELSLDAGRIWVPRIDAAIGDTIRVRILARDIMLATVEPTGISANNVLKGTVTGIHPTDDAGVDVQLVCGSTRLLSRITRRSLARLALAPGSEVFAVVKSVAVDRRAR